MKKIFLSPERRQKPHGKYWGMDVYESNICYNIAGRVKKLLESTRQFQVDIAPVESDMYARVAYANNQGYDYYLPIHTNASTNGTVEGTASGCECLYYGQVNGPSYNANKVMYDHITKLYPSKRGLKDGNAYYENRSTNMLSVYLEIAFHDNYDDALFIVENLEEISVAVANGVCDWFEVALNSQDEEADGSLEELTQLKIDYDTLKSRYGDLIQSLCDIVERS